MDVINSWKKDKESWVWEIYDFQEQWSSAVILFKVQSSIPFSIEIFFEKTEQDKTQIIQL